MIPPTSSLLPLPCWPLQPSFFLLHLPPFSLFSSPAFPPSPPSSFVPPSFSCHLSSIPSLRFSAPLLPVQINLTVPFETFFDVVCGSWVASGGGPGLAPNVCFVKPLREKRIGEVTQNRRQTCQLATPSSQPAKHTASQQASRRASQPGSQPADRPESQLGSQLAGTNPK